MRIIILNPHVNQCGKMVFNWLFRFPQHNKYTYLWEEPLKNGLNVAFFVDGKQSSFYQTSLFAKTIGKTSFLLNLFSKFEYLLWKIINNKSKKCATIYDIDQLDPQNDILFTFGFTGHQSNLSTYKGVILVHLSHYHLNTKEIAAFYKTLHNGFLVAEGEVSQNEYFRNFFAGAENRTYILPFTYYPGRFKVTKKMNERIKMCFASGPMSVPNDASYSSFYGKNVALNPMRELMFVHKDKISDGVAVYIYPHNYALSGMREIISTDSSFKCFSKKHLPIWFLTTILKIKLPYYSFDIVSKYNEYAMFSSPEERTGLPSMKLLEGILCGAVLVGINDPMYTKIGFRDGINFIAYEKENLDDLIKKIHFYQNHPLLLEEISQNGLSLVQSSFTPDKVFEIFWRDLENLLISIEKGQTIFTSSFSTK